MAETKTEAKTPAKKEPKKVASVSTNEVLEKHNQMLEFIKNTLGTIENDIKRVKLVIAKLSQFDPANPESLNEKIEGVEMNQELKTYKDEENLEVVEWKFDGYFMIGANQKKYPVPLNYSSKTKLVPGDILKLKITPDGKFIYKLINPAERKHVKSILSKTDDSKYIAVTEDGKNYFLNQAAVTFFKGKPGDELYILVNEKENASFAAIEAIIKK